MNYLKDIYYWKHLSIIKLKHDNIPATPEDDMMEYLKKWNLKYKNIIDGGSNIGLFSIVFSELIGGEGCVFAFELQTVIYQIGLENFALNSRKNIFAYNKALSDKSGEMVGFSDIDYGAEKVSSTGIRTVHLKGETRYGDIETVALDDWNIKNVGLIKLDLEGYEPKALEGMWNTIDRCKPYLIIELSNGYLGDEGVNETIEKIKSHGYSVKEISGFNYVCEPI